MNIRIITSIALATTLLCGYKSFSFNKGDDCKDIVSASTFVEDVNADTLVVERDSVVSLSEKAEVRAYVDYPAGDSTAVTYAICKFINDVLGAKDVEYKGFLFSNRKEMLRKYVDNEVRELTNEAEEVAFLPLTTTVNIGKYCETDMFVTYIMEYDTYLGGPHGSYATYYASIFKNDGSRFTMDMILHSESEEFKSLIVDGLLNYFKECGETDVTKSNLVEYLMGPEDMTINNIPLPGTSPVLTKDGVMFVYQQYEIACYAAGMPTFIIPYEKILPYLSPEARKMMHMGI